MSLWDSITSTASSAYDSAGRALSSAYNKTESVAGGFLNAAKQSVSAVGDGLADLADKGLIAVTMDNGKAAMPSPAPAAPAGKKPIPPEVLAFMAAALVGLFLFTRKKS